MKTLQFFDWFNTYRTVISLIVLNLHVICWAVAVMIFLNFIVEAIAAQVLPKDGTTGYYIFTTFDFFFNIVFLFELAWNMYGSWFYPFWKSVTEHLVTLAFVERYPSLWINITKWGKILLKLNFPNSCYAPSNYSQSDFQTYLTDLNNIFLAYDQWLSFFLFEGWNWFDFIIVSISIVAMVPGTANIPGITVLRLFRAFRVFRLFKRIESLKKVPIIASILFRSTRHQICAYLIQIIRSCIIIIRLFQTLV